MGKVSPGSGAEKVICGTGAAVMLALALLAGALSLAFSPALAMRKFCAAMDRADFAALRETARPADGGAAFTERAAQPLFRLWREDAAFRTAVRSELAAQAARLRRGETPMRGNAVQLAAKRAFLHTNYTVELTCGRAALSTNLPGAVLLLDAGLPPGRESAAGPDACFGPLLPGVYRAAVRAAGDDTFELSSRVTVLGGAAARIRLDAACVFPTLFNAGDTPADVLVNGAETARLSGGAELRLGPLRPETLVAVRSSGGGVKSARADSGGFTFSFTRCRVTVVNDYATPLTASGPEGETTVPAQSSAELEAPYGAVLTVRLCGGDEIAPYVCVCTHRSEYLRPAFRLRAAAEDAAARAARDYVSACFAAFNRCDADALARLPRTELSSYLRTAAAARRRNLTEGGAMRMTYVLTSVTPGTETLAAPCGAPEATGWYQLAYVCRFSSGESRSADRLCRFTLRPSDGAWTVVSDPA